MTKRPSDDQDPKPEADERNIVSLDSNYEGASFEDRIFLIWNDYKNVIIGVVVAAIVALAGWGAIVLWMERREARIQSEYQEAVTIDEKKAFVEANSSHRLAGAAALEIADYHYNNQEYSEAVDYYQRAATELEETPLAGRARLGKGVALGLSGREEEALDELQRVADDQGIYLVIRAEALYQAAVLAAELGDTDRAWDLAGRVEELDPTRMWSSRAMQFRATLPQADEEEIQMPPMQMQPQMAPPQGDPAAAQSPIMIPDEQDPGEAATPEEEATTPPGDS